MTDRYHVEVKVREGGNVWNWRRVHPVGGDPYVFTSEEAQAYIKTQASTYGHNPVKWRTNRERDYHEGSR